MRSSNVLRSFALVLAIAAGQFSLQIAHAHAALQQSTPAANAVVASPGQIDLVFNETLIPRASRAKLPGPLAPGVYTVEYRAVGGDNHPMTGSFSFTVR